MTVVHHNFGGAAAPPESAEPKRSALDLSADEIAENIKTQADMVLAERGAMSAPKRLARAEELVECAEQRIAAGGLLNLQIASGLLISARIMGARD